MADALPEIRCRVPGPHSRALTDRLAGVECPEVTCLTQPTVFWERATGSNVIDVDGNRYVDLVAGFGVAALGYAHPELSAVAAEQAATLPHAMGDVHPARVKVELLERLRGVLPNGLDSTLLSSSGSDAVESALKTALVVNGRPDVLAFEGAYHGLGLGALDVTHAERFRRPFLARLPSRTHFVPYGDDAAARRLATLVPLGAILVEPIQGRGGIRVPPDGFLTALREIADQTGALLIADEVYTGLCRTGPWLACEHESVVPDLVTLGKGLGAGFPISACVGRSEIMSCWEPSRGDAIHTSTHLGNPLGCALGLRVLEILERERIHERVAGLGAHLRDRLESEVRKRPGVRDVRGRGLMHGIELEDPKRAAAIVHEALRRGWILLADGPRASVLTLTPPLTIAEPVLDAAVDLLLELLDG
ncbi:MAG: aspartate aminotransferase family protein [Myxococcota bacterium]